ncbi:hypothetical protein ALC57_05220 [Trachymyrmex cornetzi]|uniref:Tyr recombinase domain-containing protein n=1 Tax=Trachymyrmex cornetzi TaxID=471704 RepID=A0A151JB95_9HYME|nr:hypothetical protein ALC57_05220 [Trachymyrmex cornetzi]
MTPETIKISIASLSDSSLRQYDSALKKPNLILPFFPNDPSICAASAVETYTERTKHLRTDKYELFISWKKPHRSITTQSLSRWIKDTLQESGMNTSIFTAYSTRHAATSAAKRKGVNIDLIRKTASWSSSSQTFARYARFARLRSPNRRRSHYLR